MMGLLQKDLRMILFYCRRYFTIAVLFSAVFLATGQQGVVVAYHTVVVTGIVSTIISYDERTGWDWYCRTLPCTRGQIVGVKYLVVLLLQLVFLGFLALVLAGRNLYLGQPVFVDWEALPLMMGVSLTMAALVLPFLFWMGVEKGRMAYYIAFLLACAGGALLLAVRGEIARPGWWVLALGAGAVFLLSWLLSARLYRKKAEK